MNDVKKKKQKCSFNSDFQNKCPFLRKRELKPHIAFCTQCSSEINMERSVLSDIKTLFTD